MIYTENDRRSPSSGITCGQPPGRGGSVDDGRRRSGAIFPVGKTHHGAIGRWKNDGKTMEKTMEKLGKNDGKDFEDGKTMEKPTEFLGKF